MGISASACHWHRSCPVRRRSRAGKAFCQLLGEMFRIQSLVIDDGDDPDLLCLFGHRKSIRPCPRCCSAEAPSQPDGTEFGATRWTESHDLTPVGLSLRSGARALDVSQTGLHAVHDLDGAGSALDQVSLPPSQLGLSRHARSELCTILVLRGVQVHSGHRIDPAQMIVNFPDSCDAFRCNHGRLS